MNSKRTWGLVSNPTDQEKDAHHARRLNKFVILVSLIATIILFFL